MASERDHIKTGVEMLYIKKHKTELTTDETSSITFIEIKFSITFQLILRKFFHITQTVSTPYIKYFHHQVFYMLYISIKTNLACLHAIHQSK